MENNFHVKICYYTPLHSSYTLYEGAVLHVCKVGVKIVVIRETDWSRSDLKVVSKTTVTIIFVACSPMIAKIIPMVRVEEIKRVCTLGIKVPRTGKCVNQRYTLKLKLGHIGFI